MQGIVLLVRGIIAVLVFATAVASCSQERSSPLRLGTNVWPGYEPLYLARETGGLSEDHILLVEYANSSDVLRGLLNDVLDAGALTLDEALSLASQRGDSDFVIFHVVDVSHGADAILARPPTASVDQLAGARIGFEVTALGSYFLSRALARGGLEISDVQPVNVEIDDQFGAWQRRDIDAVITFEPVKTRIMREGGVEVFSSRDIPGEIVDVLVIRESLLSTRSDTVQHLMNAWFDAVVLMESDPEAAYPILDRRLRLGVDAIGEAFAGLLIPSRNEVNSMLLGDQPDLLRAARDMQRIMQREGLIEQAVRAESLFPASIPGID